MTDAEVTDSQLDANHSQVIPPVTIRIPMPKGAAPTTDASRDENSNYNESAGIRDLSARDISVSEPAVEGSAIGFTLTLPPEVTGKQSISVRCKGRVVRIEGESALSAVIEEYEFLPES
jgi:hypothetical protein